MESSNFLLFYRAFALKLAHYNDPLASFARYIDFLGTTGGVPVKSLLPCHFKIRNVCPYFDKNVKHFNSNSDNKNSTSFDSFVEKIKHLKFDNESQKNHRYNKLLSYWNIIEIDKNF